MKYKISKTDGTPIDPNARYFVLRLDDHGKPGETESARDAVARYADLVRQHDVDASEAAYLAIDGKSADAGWRACREKALDKLTRESQRLGLYDDPPNDLHEGRRDET